MDTRDPDKLIALVKKMTARIAHAEMDCDYYECILDGSWPSSREILVRGLNMGVVPAFGPEVAGLVQK
jgi:hypothetical protein